jgi:membrane-bound lytic murein transglycosylase B
MQFLPATFAAYNHPIPSGGARPPSPYNAHDAIHAASNYLCASGAQIDLSGAIWAYNHSSAYVSNVLAQADAYRMALPPLDPRKARP